MAIDNTRQLIQQITNASSVGENTAARVGNAMEAMLNDVKAADDKANAATNRINTTEQGIANANQRLTTEEGINATQSAQIEGLKQEVQNIRPVTIEGDVVNNPDNVFLTSANDEITPKERTTSLSAKGHYIMRPTDNFAAKLKANYIHEIPFDVDLGGASVTIPANAVLKFTGGKISGGTLVLQNTYLDGDVNLAADVAVSGTCANLTAKQSWFADNDVDAWHRLINNVSGVSNFEYEKGNYMASVFVDKTADKQINIYGNGASVTFPHNTDGQTAFKISPSNTEEITALLTAAAAKGDNVVTVASASDFNVGDICAIHDHATSSFSPMRNYQQGEFFHVKAISGNNITPDHPIFGNYTHLTDGEETEGSYTLKTGPCTLTKFHTIGVAIRDLAIRLSGYVSTDISYGIVLDKATATLDNVEVYDFSHGISLRHCIYSSVRNCQSISNYSTAAGIDNYGLVISNCQHITIDGGRYEGGNHGISHGGNYEGNLAIINRFSSILRTITQSTKFQYGIDAHADSEMLYIRDNVSNGIGLTAPHTIIQGNTVTGDIGVGTSVEWDYIIKDNVVGGKIGFGFDATGISYFHTFKNAIYPTTKEILQVVGNTCGTIECDRRYTSAQVPNIANVTIFCDRNVIKNRVVLDVYPYNDPTPLITNGGAVILRGCILVVTTQTCRIMANKITVEECTISGSGLYLYGGDVVNILRNNITYRVYINNGVRNAINIRVIENWFNDNSFVENKPSDLSMLSTDTLPTCFITLERNKFSSARFNLQGQKVLLTDTSATRRVSQAIIRDNRMQVAAVNTIIADYFLRIVCRGNWNTYRNQLEKPTSTSGAEPTYTEDIDARLSAEYKPLTGHMYFDTSVKKPKWYDGTKWVYADGTAV